ncbi:MAG TPA: NADH-ubiquinone oxidoreductase-F iron-sulfur binding region domain-containing protein [Gaiellaceae bacterium]|nr:NADH-ubiquinone oxidoreductase-F iron-sulfur binding region domain-containing protein [Gaiellaceae bacterium]
MAAPSLRQASVAAPLGVARLLAGVRDDNRPVALRDHAGLYGPLEHVGAELISILEESRLRGRGGGAFPTGRKLAAVTGERGRPVVVVNAAEGEPASSKDRALLRLVPHLVLDGAAAAAVAIGAREIIIALARGHRDERAALVGALKERRDKVRWSVKTVPDGFVVGEETALLNALSGKAPKPTVKPPYPFERGLGGAPTLVQNAETLAHVALIARFGARWFRSVGIEAEPGTALVSLSGAVRRPGVYEVELGTRVSELIQEAGGATEALSAFLVGGYFGGWTRDPAHPLTAAGGLGAGVVIAFPAASCGVRESARVTRYLANETAGQCGPCVHGLAALASGLEEIAAPGRTPDRRVQLARWAQQVTARGACRHPDGAARFVASTLAVFEDEFSLHVHKGRCSGQDRGVLPVGSRR